MLLLFIHFKLLNAIILESEILNQCFLYHVSQ